ncbi:MAG: alpha/beta hydrolase [Candidatus Nanopelagicales bacterium]|nr:alpha/beta hydrolase [Candidatus Nanopelagicales bacterium]MDZ4250427.1 alpha/beta hydrolase [Candidatus Nanopelagicales bacterium]
MSGMTNRLDGARLEDCLAVLIHGAGSDSGFMSRAFPREDLGVARCLYLDDRSGRVSDIAAKLDEVARGADDPVVLVGVSLGAHAAATSLARGLDVAGAVLCMPAWTGPASGAADMTAAAAEAVSVLGIAAVLGELDPSDWVTRELTRSWNGRGSEDLAAELRRAAVQPAPRRQALERIHVPTGVIALSGDPMHPVSVAAAWTSVIPGAAMEVVSRDRPAESVSCFGTAARSALMRASVIPSRPEVAAHARVRATPGARAPGRSC